MRSLSTCALAVTGLFLLSSCQSISSRIARHQALYDALPEEARSLIDQGQVDLGFNPGMAYMALGHPTRIYTKKQVDRTQEIWSYRQHQSMPSFDYGPYPDTLTCRLHHHHHSSLCYGGRSTPLNSYEKLQLVFENDRIIEIKELH